MASLALSLATATAASAFLPAGFAVAGLSSAQLGFAIGSFAASSLLADDVHIDGPRMDDARVTSSAYGAVLSKIFGVYPAAGHIIDASPMRTVPVSQSSGGKGTGPTTTQTSYSKFSDIAVAIGEGPIDGLLRIRINGKVYVDNRPGATVVKPDWLDYVIYYGDEDQLPDPTFEALRGAGNVLGYRGTAYIVFRNFAHSEIGNVFTPNFEFLVARSGSSSYTQDLTQVLPPGETANNTNQAVYDPGSDLLIYATSGVSNHNYALTAINPYTREIVWQLEDDSGERYQHVARAVKPVANTAALCIGAPGYIAVARDNDGNTSLFQLIDAQTGTVVNEVIGDVVTFITGFDYSVYDDGCVGDVFYTDSSGVGRAFRRTNFYGLAGGSVTIDPPPGWEIGSGVASNGRGAIGVELADNFNASAWAFAIYDSSTGQYPVIVPLATNIAELFFIKDYWLIVHSGGDFLLIDANGDTYHSGNLATDYGVNGYFSVGRIGAFYSATSDSFFVQGVDALYEISMTDLTQPARSYPVTTQRSVVAVHEPTDRIWWTIGVSHQVESMRLNATTGAPSSLADTVEEICTDNSNLQASDLDLTALASINVEGFGIAKAMARRNALQQLQAAYLFDLVMRGAQLTAVLRGQSVSATLTDDHIGAYLDGAKTNPPPPWLVEGADPLRLPKQLEVRFVDPDKAFEPGSQIARRQADGVGLVRRVSLSVVMTNQVAAKLGEILLHLAHIESEQYSTRCMPSQIDTVLPGAVLAVNHDGKSYALRVTEAGIAEGRTIELRGLRESVDLFTYDNAIGGSPLAPGGTVAVVGATILWPLDLPMLRTADNGSWLYLIAGSLTPGWDGGVIEASRDGIDYAEATTITNAATFGTLKTLPTNLQPMHWWTDAGMTVSLIHGDLASTNRQTPTYAAIGANGRWVLTALTTAAQQPDGTWQLSDLVAGLQDTGAAVDSLAVGDQFVVLNEATVQRIALAADDIGSIHYLRGTTLGRSTESGTVAPLLYEAKTLTPLAPVAVHAEKDGSNNWSLSWRRQERVDARAFWRRPNSEADESYLVTFLFEGGSVAGQKTVIGATTVALTTTEQQGFFNRLVSGLRFSVAQISAVVGAGNAREVAVGKFLGQGYIDAIQHDADVYHPMNETAGTVMAELIGTLGDSGQSLAGAYVGNPVFSRPPILLKGTSVQLGNGDNYAYWDNTQAAFVNDYYLVEFGLRIASLPASTAVVIQTTYLQGGENKTPGSFMVALEPSGNLSLKAWAANGVYQETPHQEVTTAQPLSVGENYHVICSTGPNGSGFEIRINGAIAASAVASGVYHLRPGLVGYGHNVSVDTSFASLHGDVHHVSWPRGGLQPIQIEHHFLEGIDTDLVRAFSDYAIEVFYDDPIAFHLLDESSGTTIVDLTGVHNGTYHNAPTLADTPVLPFGNAVTFGAGGDYASFSETWYNEDVSAVEFSLRLDALPTGEACVIQSAKTDNTSAKSIAVTVDSSGILTFRSWENDAVTPTNVVSTVSALSLSTSYQIVILFDDSPGNIAIYLNGVQDVSAATVGSVILDHGTVSYGKNISTNTAYEDLEGSLQAISWHRSVLSPGQITAHVEKGINA